MLCPGICTLLAHFLLYAEVCVFWAAGQALFLHGGAQIGQGELHSQHGTGGRTMFAGQAALHSPPGSNSQAEVLQGAHLLQCLHQGN